MAKNEQNENAPSNNGKRKSSDLLPRFFRTTANNKFLQSTLDQLVQPGVAEKINGYYGRKTAKAFNSKDTYVGDVTPTRENYQLEPSLVIKDELGNVDFYKDYNDYINQIRAFGGNTSNHSKINSQETYAWNPNIDWDKFVNFREYYWLPTGPQSVPVYGQSKEIVSTYTVELVEDDDNFAYLFTPNGRTRNPSLKLFRGQTYRFEVDVPGHPIAFAINRSWTPGAAVITAGTEGVRGPGLFGATLYDDAAYDTGDFIVLPSGGSIAFEDDDNVSQLYPDGIRKLGEEGEEVATVYLEKGTIEFTIPDNAPDRLYYISKNDIDTSGEIRINDIEENTFLDVENEILGKKDYTSANGVKFSNGMKVYFQGQITPTKYEKGQWYVEGVGDKIKLVNENDLIIPTAYSEELLVPFDSQPFDRLPFGSSSTYAANKDYIVINRASQDRNAWSRYNRWIHRDVIEESARLNNQPVDVNQSQRAKRPIIEFKAGLKLFNFGTQAKLDIDLIDDFTKDVFSTIEGSVGYNVDGIDLAQGMRILFVADTDILVKNKIYTVNFVTVNNRRQISLLETDDTDPLDLETVLVTNGNTYAGKTLSFENNTWNVSQEKTKINQQPLFDMCDNNGNSYNDNIVYESSSFTGTKLFSYRQGTGTNDPELGFPLAYKNIENSGDIIFDFNLLTDSFKYQTQDGVFEVKTDNGFLKKYTDLTTFTYENGWSEIPYTSKQYVIRQYVAELGNTNNFEIDVYKDAGELNDLRVIVYKNNKKQLELTDYEVDRINKKAFVRFLEECEIGDNIVFKTESKTNKNDNGYYEFPHNLERNPLNEDISEFTLGEVSDHLDSIVEELRTFTGEYPGRSNIRDLGDIDRYGKRFVKHSGPINLPMYHITNKSYNIVKAIKFAKSEYSKFKRNFITVATELGFDGSIKDHVDAILNEINRDKNKGMPFYFSDMVPVGPSRKLEYTVLDPRNPFYALSKSFDLNTLSQGAVQVYKNGQLLIHNKDYTFSTEGFALIVAGQQEDDFIEIYEWESTDGSYVPPTPTKLGLYPSYEPYIYTDYSYAEPVQVIQGHDGSIVKAFGDYRDNLILELERRIFNNIKQQYNPEILDIHSFKGGEYRDTSFTKQDIDDVLLSDFIGWQQLVDSDYTENSFYDRDNQFTFNYGNMSSPNGNKLPGYWRGVYLEAYDTDRPNTHPWEMLGLTIKPSWWEEVYGPAPYTRNNLILWKDLEQGVIREPNKKVIRKPQYARPGLLNHIPVDDSGNIAPPLGSNYAKNYVQGFTRNKFAFGDHSPVESAWRKSSEYPFSFITAWVLNQPSKIFGIGFDYSRIEKNLANQYVYKNTGKHIETSKLELPNTYNDNNRVLTSGLVNYIYNLISSNVKVIYESYQYDLKNMQNQLGIKLAGFTDKNKFNLLLDSRSPSATVQGGIFVPQENYQIFLNTSSPIGTPVYSGVTIEKNPTGFIIRGYSFDTPYFNYYDPVNTQADVDVVVGGVSEDFVDWESGRRYVKTQIIRENNRYYRATENFTSGSTFNEEYLQRLPELPIVGGRRAKFKRVFNNRNIRRLNYGSLLRTTQEVVDFLLGYQEYLKSIGFEFDYFNDETSVVENWDFSAREFLFWTTQNWTDGSAISLSPSASIVEFQTEYAVVDNLFDNFYDYSILNSDARSVLPEFSHTLREDNSFGLTFKNTSEGVYHIKLPLVQKEHVLLLDNKTQFNDIIYERSTGYRQERIKALGYKSDNWNGSLNIPGFIYDDARVTNWKEWTDYKIGSLVKYKEFYYVSIVNITGSSQFDSSQWSRLSDKPESELLTNFDYKINQFGDFYDLDTDNFDAEQQKLAQHLIGYQKRNYLQNIINDDVSQYKFYQGFIQDKGTTNALTKLFDALGAADKDSLEFYEEWAIQTGQYGASENTDYIEYQLDEKSFNLSPQPIELVTQLPAGNFDKIYRIRPYEIYDQTGDFLNTPFPITDNVNEYIRSSGYARADDVRYRVSNIDSYRALRVSDLDYGDYVWAIDDNNYSWTVSQFVDLPLTVNRIEPLTAGADQIDDSANPFVRLYLNKYPTGVLNVGDYVGLIGADAYNALLFYTIVDITRNEITVQTSTATNLKDTGTTEVAFPLTVLRKVRASNIDEANDIVQSKKLSKQRIWLDDYENNWAVIENDPVFSTLQSITNPSQDDSTFHDFGSVFSVNKNNRILIIGSPGELDGRVHVYNRNLEKNNSVLQQTILPPEDVIDSENNNYEFGSSVSVSPDGEYLAIGIPNATNVKTRSQGTFDPDSTYQKTDIIKYREAYWKANREILPGTAGQSFETFNSYLDIVLDPTTEDSSLVRLVFTGDPGLPNSTVDHFLVRAEKDAYLATNPGDQIGLTWNRFSRTNTTLDEVLPWDDDCGFKYSDISGTHTIINKVDVLFFIPTFVALPTVGDFVTTATGTAEVVYVSNVGDAAVIYGKNQNGIFDLTGNLFIGEDQLIGAYSIEETDNLVEGLGGLWMLSSIEYDNGNTWYEQGKGLIYNDVKLAEESRNIFPYYNIQNLISFLGSGRKQKYQASQIINLKYLDDPDAGSPNQINPEDILGPGYEDVFLVRGAKGFTDDLSPGDTTRLNVYDLDNYVIDVEAAGFTFDQLNKRQTVIDLWDGFIDLEYTEFDFIGNPFPIEVGDTIEDVQYPFDAFGGVASTPYAATSTGEVVYVQFLFNSARVYLKNITGTWNVLNNVARYKIKRLGNPTLRGAGDPDRVAATVDDPDVGIALGTSNVDDNFAIGKLIMFKSDTPLALPESPYAPNIQTPTAFSSAAIVDEEYWFFDNKTTVGDGRLPNIPTSLNKDYTQVYNVPVNEFGKAKFYNEGVVAIYRRGITNDFDYVTSIVSENRANDKHFGQKVKFIQNENDYTLFVSSRGDGTPDNNGTVEIIKNGFSVEQSSSFVGGFTGQKFYPRNSIVYNRGKYYRAIRDVPELEFGAAIPITNTIYWEDYSWRYGKDENYRGLYQNDQPYVVGEIVSHPIDDSTLAEPALYRAITNIAVGSPSPTTATTSWERITDGVDYLGYLPNRSGTALFNEEVFNPEKVTIQFGENFTASENGNILVISSKQATDSTPETIAVIYRLIDGKYYYDQSIYPEIPNTGFAKDIKVSPDGKTIAISEPFSDVNKTDQGSVHIYKQVNGKFQLDQTLFSPKTQESEKFGYSIALDNKSLAISSINGDITIPTIFDGETTTFDNNFTQFRNVQYDSGIVYIYESIGNKFIFSEEFKYRADNLLYFGEHLSIRNNHVYVSVPRYRYNDVYQGLVVDFRKPTQSTGWTKLREPNNVVDVSKIQKIYLYNTETKNIVTYLDYIDTLQGKIAGSAEQELTFKIPYDPAMYNITPIADLYSESGHWGPDQVGHLWWDTSNAKVIYPYQGDITFQSNNFNLINPGTSIDILEWVESDLIPSEWDNVADTETGLKKGISGTSVYSDALYVQKINYDPVSRTFGSKFYFWVKNKQTIPNKDHRSISAASVASLIQDPSQQGYRHVSFLTENRFVLHNCESLLNDKDIAIHIEWLSGPNAEQNKHTQYQILSEGLETSKLNKDIERKWFDSLIGYDEKNKLVPDPSLSIRQKYGNKFKPRQSMFVNKTEALKQVIERVNLVLAQQLVVDEYDISALTQSQSIPTDAEREFDRTIDIVEELQFVGTSKVTPAVLQPVISNGEIIRVDIIESGRGYNVPPSYEIQGTGSGAEIDISINNLGQVTSVNVISTGREYEQNTVINVRRFSVLVKSDNTVYNKWSIYSWNETSKQWFRQSVQEYDVNLFWNYIDYYAEGYNQFTQVNFEVDQSYELFALNDRIGDIIRINNIGSGGWLLLRKVANEDTEDYTINYDTIGRQDGTIQFTSSLYDLLGNSIGYDARSYDSYFYDSQPLKETRIILETVRDHLFVADLSVEYNKLWFASLRYAFSEQRLVDWAFKTSFVKAKHNLGQLDQDITFDSDNLPDYESYINEVKPYSTTVREFVSAYDAIDNTQSAVTDFDLSPQYNNDRTSIIASEAVIVDNVITNENLDTDAYPRKFWKDNVGYQIKSVDIANPGSGYTFPPKVSIIGGGGTGATARAYIGSGKVTKIEVTNPGEGYVSQPTIEISGSQIETGVPASASVVLGNGKVKSTKVAVKFDRVKGSYQFTELSQTELFTGSGNVSVYDLEWPMDLNNTLVKVYIDDRLLLRSEYRYTNFKDTSKSYTRQQGRIIFATPPASGTTIKVEYFKAISMLDAADRIYHGYSAFEGMFGKDLGQLMDGVDYGGVEIRSFDFSATRGWDSDTWYDGAWDPYVNTYEDEIFTFDGSTVSIQLSQPLENGVTYNVYFNGERIDDPNFDSAEMEYDGVIINPIQGDGITDVLYLDELGIIVSDGDTLIIRKETSDGSFAPQADDYDTALSGGDLPYATATGIAAEDIIVDGDGFVTPTTSKGPEELVPGQIIDTLDLQVYTRQGSGQGTIYSQSYITANNSVTYDLGVIPNSPSAVIVKLNNIVLAEDEYTIDYDANTITLNAVPVDGQEFNIITLGESYQNILDTGVIIADGSSFTFNLPIEYIETLSGYFTVNAEVVNGVIIAPEEGTNYTTIILPQVYDKNVEIRYAMFYDNTQVNYSQVTKNNLNGDGSTVEFEIPAGPLYKVPTPYNTIVKVGNKILNPGYNIQYIIPENNQREYQLELFQQPQGSISSERVQVYVNGEQITINQSWRFDIFNSSVVLFDGTGDPGDIIEIYILEDGEYNLEGNLLSFAVPPADGAEIEVYTFTNHDILQIERISYDVVSRSTLTVGSQEYATYHRLTSGEVLLRDPAIDTMYVWVSVNGELLTPSVDYYLTEDKTRVRISQTLSQDDVIDIVHFSAPVSTDRFAFRQFKDMLNRTHFKRIDSAETFLAQDLNWYDVRIEVVNGDALPQPNKGENLPGIIFIDKERIEYLVKEGNTLRQIRRGTLGTGVATVHSAGEGVYEQGPSKTVPYKDETLTQIFTADGTTATYALDFIPATVDEFDVFVAGRRLRKNAIDFFDYTKALDSTEGDITLAPEFSIDGETNILTLSENPVENTQVMVIRKIGKVWSPTGTELAKAENDIARFLRAGTIKLYE